MTWTIRLALVALGVLLFTLVVLGLLLSTASGWRGVRDESLIALTAWSSFAAAVGTALLFGGAVITAAGLRHQIEQAEQHHKTQLDAIQSSTTEQIAALDRARIAASTPFLWIINQRVVLTAGEAQRLEVRFVNVGVGPAINPRVEAWLVPIRHTPTAEQRGPAGRDAVMDQVNRDEPDFAVQIGALGMAAPAEISLLPEGRESRRLDGNAGFFVVFHVTCQDVRGEDGQNGGQVAWVSRNDATTGIWS